MFQIQSLARRFTTNEDISANNSPEVDFHRSLHTLIAKFGGCLACNPLHVRR